jgi:general secretion pathway protein J
MAESATQLVVRSSRGFTLLEVLIAMAIFSMISLASFTIFNTVISSDESSRLHSERLYQLQRAFIIIQRDLLQVARRSVRLNGEAPLKRYLHTEQAGLSSDTETLGFVRGGWRNPGLLLPRSDLQSVAYRLQDGVLERLHFNFVDVVVAEQPKIRPLIDKVTTLKFEFFDGTQWQQQAPEQTLPLAIAIELNIEDFGVVRRQFLLAGDDAK